jgi:hypothetical protein
MSVLRGLQGSLRVIDEILKSPSSVVSHKSTGKVVRDNYGQLSR